MWQKILFGFIIAGVSISYFVFLMSSLKPESLREENDPGHPLQVVASFFPYAEFARAVAGGSALVTTLVPSGVEPHDFEPTPRDMEKLYQADVVILNGAGIDAWAEKLMPELERRGVRIVRMVDFMDPLSAHKESRESEISDGDEYDDHEESGLDPHFWLDPVLAEIQIQRIEEAFSEVNPAHQAQYESRREEVIEALHALDQEYVSGLRTCRLRTVVTAHDAFTYLAKRYTLEVVSIAGLSPNAEPSPGRLVEITRLVRERDIRYIFFETLSSPKLSETLAREAGIGTLVFNPIEGGMIREDGSSETYFNLMRQNLTQLRTALECL
ncbi:MAG: zinc ABC transporter substrate-binding protein [Candidatus Moranbacteria bacterium]|nr:zinc ABC transporter substrate-binding protein [Candidatus Moranbacteria bacterium]